jgi:hypothetical protein
MEGDTLWGKAIGLTFGAGKPQILGVSTGIEGDNAINIPS